MLWFAVLLVHRRLLLAYGKYWWHHRINWTSNELSYKQYEQKNIQQVRIKKKILRELWFKTSFPMKLNSKWLKLAEHVEYRGRSDRKWQQAERCGPATDLIKIAAWWSVSNNVTQVFSSHNGHNTNWLYRLRHTDPHRHTALSRASTNCFWLYLIEISNRYSF